MKNITLIFILFSLIISEGNDANNYKWPSNASNTITTVFGDERSRRFHAGIDVRTYGIIGKEIYAVDSGFIERIKITHNGYGKAIYLKLIDGNTVLYAHLDKFNDTLEKKIKEIQKSEKNSFVDIYFKKNEFRFKKGDIIAYSGDTGSLSGPHLHFEIRNKDGKPINPLKNYFAIKDTIKPLASSIAFVPLDNSCWINGIQDYSMFELNKINDFKYVLNDTISIIGNFGILLETHDKVNKQPFDFGIYSIELLIDNKPEYKLQFDEYYFKDDPLIYKEIDFYLSHNYSKKYHNLFINDDSKLDFINPDSNHGININHDYHNIIINVSDINNNKIQIQAILKGDILFNHEITYDRENQILYSEKGFNNMHLYYTTRYMSSKLIPASFTELDLQSIKLNIAIEPYDVIQYYLTNSNGLKSKTEFLALNDFDPYRINGKIKIKQFNKGIIIEFIEDVFSGYNANVQIDYNENNKMQLNLYRKEKNILSTGLINIDEFENINSIKIKYLTEPEIIFNETINSMLVDNTKKTSIKHNNYYISSQQNSLYNNIIMAIQDTNIVTNSYDIIDKPIKIMPEDTPFKNSLILFYNLEEIKESKGAIFNYNRKKDEWIHMKSFNSSNFTDDDTKLLKTEIYSGGIFAILNENIKPRIENISPSFNSKYKSTDLTKVSFNIDDEDSGINHNSIVVKIDGIICYYTYIPYRRTVECTLDKKLDTGEHVLEIYAEDNIFNSTYKKVKFYIE